MSWGGMAGGGNWGGGGHWGGSAPGLPFAGIPPEYLERINELVADEPDPPDPEIEFSQTSERESFTLRAFLRPHIGALALAVLLVTLETAAAFVGPRLTGYGIDSGVLAGDVRVLVIVAAIYLGSIVVHAFVSFARISWTGRLGQQLMVALRVRVFTHLQRLSLDFYTREKAGRIMTRMTSDIEALQNLFTEGFVNLTVQAVGLLVMIGFMITMNVKIMPITGSRGGSSTPGRSSCNSLGRIRLSSQMTMDTIAQMVMPIGAKKTTPATK